MRRESKSPGLLAFSPEFKDPWHRAAFALTRGMVEAVLGVPALNRLYEEVSSRPEDRPFPHRVLDALNVRIGVSDEDLARIPRAGPVVVVANHPFGAVEGLALARILLDARPDVRFLANNLLGMIPEMRPYLFLVDAFGGPGAKRRNGAPLREALSWLEGNGMLVVFPAGEVSRFDPRKGRVQDPAWSQAAARLVRRAGAAALPIFIHGRNSALFHLSGLVHPRLPTALLGQELLNKRNHTLRVEVGRPVAPERVKSFSVDEDLTAYLRLRVEILQNRVSGPLSRRVGPADAAAVPVAEPQPTEVLEAEVSSLSSASIILETERERVFVVRAREIPRLVLEIGRLREITFRAVGEGTGRARDLDEFDAHYLHLFLWDKEARAVAGAYRLGPTDEILPRFGVKGLYTRSLFKFGRGFTDRLGPALELGRSFVASAYQKSFASLLLLWQGVCRYAARNPRYRRVFGPVSISDQYGEASRRLMMDFLEQTSGRPELARHVVPLYGFRGKPVAGWSDAPARRLPATIEEISDLVGELEPDQKGVPILLKHYLRIGGKILGFNVDPAFNDVLDGLILVDLLEADRRSIRRYMGVGGLNDFLSYYGCPESAQADAVG